MFKDGVTFLSFVGSQSPRQNLLTHLKCHLGHFVLHSEKEKAYPQLWGGRAIGILVQGNID